MTTPQITITIPVYNTEKYLRRCIESVLSQTFQNFEIIIVNDCSQDQSLEIVAHYISKDKRIKAIQHQTNLGLMRARETGYKNAKGEYILFLDSDDSLPETALEDLYIEAKRTGSEIIGGKIAYIIDDNSIKYDAFPCSLPYGKSQTGIIHAILNWKFTHNLCGKLFHRRIFSDYIYKTFDNCTIGEDGLLFYQIIEHINTISTTQTIVYNYYRNKDSSTQVKYSNKALKSFITFYDFRYQFISRLKILEKELNQRTLQDLCIICGSGNSYLYLNKLLDDTDIPFRIGIRSIYKIMDFNEALRCLVKIYVISPYRYLKSKLLN